MIDANVLQLYVASIGRFSQICASLILDAELMVNPVAKVDVAE